MKPERNKKILGDGPAYTSLICSAFFGISCIELGSTISATQLTGFQTFKIMGASLVLAAVALLLRSKLWRVAPPFALLMFSSQCMRWEAKGYVTKRCN